MDQKTKNTNTLLIFVVAMSLTLGCMLGAIVCYSYNPNLAYKMVAMAVSVFIIAHIYWFKRFKKIS
jgi:hypothetical protein